MQPLRVSAIPLVNYLVVISDHEKVFGCRINDVGQNAILRKVGILEFIDTHVRVNATYQTPDSWVCFEQP